MKKLMMIITFAATGIMFGQTVATSTGTIQTGVKDLDASLNIINSIAKEDISKFKTELASTYNVQPVEVDNILKQGLEPAEAFLAFTASDITKQPVTKVVDTYKKNKGKGWGAVAKSLGIKPGSEQFFALKNKAKDKQDKMEKEKKEKGDKGEKEDKTEKDDKDKDKDKDKGNKGTEKESKGNSSNNNSKTKGKSGK